MSVRPAPFFLTGPVVAAVLDRRDGARLVNVRVVPIALVDRPRRSEDPQLARANDDGDAL